MHIHTINTELTSGKIGAGVNTMDICPNQEAQASLRQTLIIKIAIVSFALKF